jgi:hypothetical protein
MKTKLTLRVLREGEKDLQDASHCIGATLLRKALNEHIGNTGTDLERWVSWGTRTGYSRDNVNILRQYKSLINGEGVSLMRLANYTTWQRLKLFFFPLMVEFKEIGNS